MKEVKVFYKGKDVTKIKTPFGNLVLTELRETVGGAGNLRLHKHFLEYAHPDGKIRFCVDAEDTEVKI
jgi:hypothetical protein